MVHFPSKVQTTTFFSFFGASKCLILKFLPILIFVCLFGFGENPGKVWIPSLALLMTSALLLSFLVLVCSIMLLISLFFHELLFNNLLTTYPLLGETHQNLLQSSEIILLHWDGGSGLSQKMTILWSKNSKLIVYRMCWMVERKKLHECLVLPNRNTERKSQETNKIGYLLGMNRNKGLGMRKWLLSKCNFCTVWLLWWW